MLIRPSGVVASPTITSGSLHEFVQKNLVTGPKFVAYEQFNDPALHEYASMKHRLHALPGTLFPTDDFPDRLARKLAEHRVVHIKELLESFEFFARTRKRLRRPAMVDLCAGHGLTGLIFAACERRVQRVTLIDERKPDSFDRIWQAFVEIAPWVDGKVHYLATSLDGDLPIEEGAGVALVHACGSLTDRGLRHGMRGRGPIAAMPCCYGKAEAARVPGLTEAFGYQKTVDISRSFTLADAGYRVDWSHIPEAITPMNRILVAWAG